MKNNVHAGHNPTGKPGCGAVGIIDESTENRRVKDEVISQLRQLGHEVYDCTVNDGSSQSDVLKKIVKKCNSHEVDLDLGIHFHSIAKDWIGEEEASGTEAYIYSENGTAKEYALRICENIAQIGFRNRGVKEGGSLYVLRMTNAPAILLECCYVDHKGDVERYDYRSMASAEKSGVGRI